VNALDAHALARARLRAERAARAGGEVIAGYQHRRGELDVQEKGTNELVTQVDVEAQRAIVASLEGAVDGAVFLAEEEELGDGTRPDRCWVIDPLDGTTNFTHGIPPWAVSVALVDRGRPVAGAVLDVSSGELFSAARGQGLTADGRPARVSSTPRLADSLLSTGFPYRDQRYADAYLEVLKPLMAGTRGVRRHGAAAVDLAWVAAGRFDGFFELNLSPWDVAAGILLIEEGGGRVTDFRGDPDPVFRPHLVATNGHLHDALLALAHPLAQAQALFD
jgi:myo-inositol-1(or 4)-monophosphatase